MISQKSSFRVFLRPDNFVINFCLIIVLCRSGPGGDSQDESRVQIGLIKNDIDFSSIKKG